MTGTLTKFVPKPCRRPTLPLPQPGILLALVAVSIAATLSSDGAAAEPVAIHVSPETVVQRIPPDFIGFGYETSAVALTNYFSAGNKELIQLYRNLSSDGLIRIGGNVSDHARYEPDGVSAARTEREVTVINRRNLQDLEEFARATGWRVMWGLNFGTGSKEEAAREAHAVSDILGDRLQSLQIGNEVDLRSHYTLKYDDFASYYSNYLACKRAILAVVPEARFSGPDVAGNLEWFRKFSRAEAGHVEFLTHHYYRTGANRPEATIQNLLASDHAWDDKLRELQQISRDAGTPFRINEVNSFYGGGKRGVSDTYASALWCLDYMLVLASHGCDGVNLETDVNQLGWISHYSPIVHEPSGKCTARPEYYALLAFGMAAKGDLLKIDLDKQTINLTAYATRPEDQSIWLVAVNKDGSRDAELKVGLPGVYARAEAFWLKAPGAQSTNEVTLAGTQVAADGRWTPGPPNEASIRKKRVELIVPHLSALLLHFRQ